MLSMLSDFVQVIFLNPLNGSANFVAEQYIDRWYNLANTPFPFMNTKNRCPWANYTLESDGSVKVVNSEVLWWKNERKYATGKAYVNPDLPGTLDVAFGPVQPDPHGDNYIILDTDNTRRVIEFRGLVIV